MPRTKVTVSEEGKDTPYEGVLVGELLKRAGAPVGRDLSGKAVATYVRATAKDGYQVVFSLAELDPGFTSNDIIVADTIDGKPLFDYQGPLRIVAPHGWRRLAVRRRPRQPEQEPDGARIHPHRRTARRPARVSPLADRRGAAARPALREPVESGGVLPGEFSMALSARNHLPGIIDEIVMGDVLAHITVRVGEHVIESVITRRSAEEMGLKKGDTVTAVVKATEVMLAKG